MSAGGSERSDCVRAAPREQAHPAAAYAAAQHEASGDTRPHTTAALSDPDCLNRLGEIEVTAVVELGSADMPLRHLAALEPGAVVRLDRPVAEPAELTVNGRPFARGELVVVGDHIGLRITDLAQGSGTRRNGT